MAVISSIQIDTSSASKSIADLEKELQETNEQLKQVDINSDVFKDLQKKAANAKGQLDRINQTTDTLSKGFQGFGENLAKVTGGISGGITAATAAMQLMGVENENVLAGIAKLQQMMAFTQGISALKDLIEGFKILKRTLTTLIGTSGPLGLVVLALSAIATGWSMVKNKNEEATKAAEDYQTIVEKTADYFSEKSQSEYLSKLPENVQKQYKDAQAEIEKLSALIEENYKEGLKFNAGEISYEEYKKLIENGEKLNKERNKYKAILKEIDKNYKKIIDDEAKWQKTQSAQQQVKDAAILSEKLIAIEQERLNRLDLTDKQRYEKQLELAEKHLKNMKVLYGENSLEYETALTDIDTILKNLKNDLETTSLSSPIQGITVAAADANAALQNLQGTYQKTGESALNFQQQVLLTKNALDEEFGIINDTFAKLSESTYGLSSEWQDAFSDIMQATDSFLNALSKGTDSAAEDWVKVAAAGAQAIGSVLNTLADQQDSTTKEGFEQQKKYQYAATVMNAAGGVMNAWASAMNPSNAWMTIWGQIAMGASTSAAILALMGVQLAKIKSTPFEGGSSSSSNASLSAAASSITTPQQYSTAVEGAEIESSISDSRVYVVESDIQAVGNKVNVQETENRY